MPRGTSGMGGQGAPIHAV